MSALSNYLEIELADHILGGVDYVRPATVYVALYTITPTDASAGTEVAGGSYARASVTNNATNFPASTDGSKANATVITFAEATGSWGLVTGYAVFDAASGGNMLFYGTLTTSKSFTSGDTPKINIGGLTFQLF